MEWFEANYRGPDGRKRFASDSGKRGERPLTKGRISQLFDDDEPFGEHAGRHLAHRFGLPDDYFEHDHDQPDADAAEMVRAYQAMKPSERARLRRLMDAARDDPPESGEREQLRGESIFGALPPDDGNPKPRSRK